MPTQINRAAIDRTSEGQQSTMLQFINIINPADAANVERKKRIRSHAAKQVYLYRLCRRRGSLEIRPYRPIMSSSTTVQEETVEENCDSNFDFEFHQLQNQKIFGQKNEAVLKDIIPQLWSCNLNHLLTQGRRNPFHSYPRNLTDIEHFLVDHYITYVVDNGYQNWNNGPGCTTEDFLWHMKMNFVPWALANKHLLASVLMISCYNLSTLYPKNNLLKTLHLDYKGKCIETVRDALSQEQPITDAVITLALMLVAEGFMSRDRDGFVLHARGVLKMNSGRESIVDQGPGGCLGYFLYWTVYNPRHGVVIERMVEK
ncbi:hypothetical protein GGI43DRAFT_425741 [Trichoderma evansii]